MHTITSLQTAIDIEVKKRTVELLELVNGQLFFQEIPSESNVNSPVVWILRAQKGTLEKFKILLPTASKETSFGLVALARNLFENLVWLKHFNIDKSYGIAFYRDLLNQQGQSQRQSIAQARYESEWYKELEREDGPDIEAAGDLLDRVETLSDDEKNLLRERINRKSDALDAKVNEEFTIYGDQAKVNSYGYQSHLIRTKIIPHHEERLKIIDEHSSAFESIIPSILPQDKIDMISRRWVWKDRSIAVGMKNQYEFIYSFTSKILHCGGMSLITETKLDEGERKILLNFIRVCTKDAHIEIDKFRYSGQVMVRAVFAGDSA